MSLTPEQVKGRIKNIAVKSNADARTLMRIYMMERFLERLANSRYRDNFIIKGGILVTAMVGVAHRSTMDIESDERLRNHWESYRIKFSYASEITYQDTIDSIKILITLIANNTKGSNET